MDEQSILVKYKNYKNIVSIRRIRPNGVWYGKTKYHNREQWLLNVFDYGRSAFRDFAVKDIKEWDVKEKKKAKEEKKINVSELVCDDMRKTMNKHLDDRLDLRGLIPEKTKLPTSQDYMNKRDNFVNCDSCNKGTTSFSTYGKCVDCLLKEIEENKDERIRKDIEKEEQVIKIVILISLLIIALVVITKG